MSDTEQISVQYLLPFGEISVVRAAEMLRCSEATVYRLIEQGQLKAYRLTPNGWYRVVYESLVDYANSIAPA